MNKRESYKLVIETNINTSSSVYQRNYTLFLDKEVSKDTFIGTLISQDITPSGYIDGNSKRYLLQNAPIQLNLMEINKCIAKLALKYDNDIIRRPNEKSISIIRNQLKELSTTEQVVIDVS